VVHRQRFGDPKDVGVEAAKRVLGLRFERVVGDPAGRIESGTRDRAKRREVVLVRGLFGLVMGSGLRRRLASSLALNSLNSAS
jgi:hypothetical protein